MYVHYNPNPCGKSVGDCVIRALTKALKASWHDVYLGLTVQGYMDCNWGSSNAVWGRYLQSRGYRKHQIDGCTVAEFAASHPHGDYILGTGEHVIALHDGDWYDSWDSDAEIVIFYFKKEP